MMANLSFEYNLMLLFLGKYSILLVANKVLNNVSLVFKLVI